MTNHRALRGACAAASPPHIAPVQEWLVSAHPSPATAFQEWSSAARLALIPLGRLFDAVRMSESLVQRLVGPSDPATVNRWFGWSLNGGPVIHDPAGRRYYALVPPGTAPAWGAPAAACLGEGTYLGVPRTDLTELGEHALSSYWAVPVTRPGRLCQAADVLSVVMAARVPEDDEGGRS